jgi:hypothetical protein
VGNVTINLKSGWNLVSLPLIPTNGNISALFSGKPVSAIWSTTDGINWHYYGDGVLTALVDGQGYWVYMTSASSVLVYGSVNPVPACPSCAPKAPPTYSVAAGWNMIGFKSTCERTASSYLSGVPSWVRIWSFDDGQWVPVQSGDMMKPTLGYWLAATSPGTIFP